jgi:Zn-dependent protease
MARREIDRTTMIVYGVLAAIFVFSVYSARGAQFSLGDVWGYDGVAFRWGVYAILSMCAIVIDSVAVATVAQWYGDGRPSRLGRRRLALKPHADVFGTYIMPFVSVIALTFPFGWAKPIELNPIAFKKKRHMVITRLSGIVANLLVAGVVVFALSTVFPADISGFVSVFAASTLSLFAVACCLLAVLYMMPVHPLPGAAWLEAILPPSWQPRYYRIRPYLIIVFGIILLFATRVFTSFAARFLNWWLNLFV